MTEPIQQVYKVPKPGSATKNVKVDIIEELDNEPVVMSLHTIVNYQYLKRINKLSIRLYTIPMDDIEMDHHDIYIHDYPELKMHILEMIYGTLKNYKYLAKDFEDISHYFESKNVEGYSTAINILAHRLKVLGATRPYYVCIKIFEIFQQYLSTNKAEAINIDID
jgi:hypothetical protein